MTGAADASAGEPHPQRLPEPTASPYLSPMTTRRGFVSSVLGAGVSLPVMRSSAFGQLFRAEPIAGGRAAVAVAEDETYWREIQRAFDLDRTMINLNNGGCSPAPSHVLEQMIRDLKFSNELPTEHMWRVLEPRIESVRRDLAKDFGCDPEEMAITRNASEANETMIFGLDLKAGDEVVYTTQNYPRMRNAWTQRQRREGIVLKPVKIETPVKSTKSYVDQIAAAITPRTRVIEVMHISFMTGYIAPVKEIVELAKPKGIQVFVDGAHAFAHFPFTRDELGADYYGTSLHKWMHAPIGTGFLYVRRDKIKSLWPLMAGGVDQEVEHPEVRGDRHASGGESQRHRGRDRVQPRDWTRAENRAASLPARPVGEPPACGERPCEDDHADRSEHERRHRRVQRRRARHGQARRMAPVEAQHRDHADGQRRVQGHANHAQRLHDGR